MVSETAKKQFDTIQVYLLDNTTYEQAAAMLSELSGTDGVKEASYLSNEEAMAKWRTKWGGQRIFARRIGKTILFPTPFS